MNCMLIAISTSSPHVLYRKSEYQASHNSSQQSRHLICIFMGIPFLAPQGSRKAALSNKTFVLRPSILTFLCLKSFGRFLYWLEDLESLRPVHQIQNPRGLVARTVEYRWKRWFKRKRDMPRFQVSSVLLQKWHVVEVHSRSNWFSSERGQDVFHAHMFMSKYVQFGFRAIVIYSEKYQENKFARPRFCLRLTPINCGKRKKKIYCNSSVWL